MCKLGSKWQRNQKSNCQRLLDNGESKGIPEKLASLTVYAKEFLRKILKEMGTPDHLTCLLRNLYTGQETTVRTRHGTMGWFQTVKEVRQGSIPSPCLFNLYEKYIVHHEKFQAGRLAAGIKIAGRNINNVI